MAIRISQPSHQSLYIEMRANGRTIARGTAFVAQAAVGNAFLVTNRHNVTGRNQDTGEPLCKRTGAIPDSLLVWHNATTGLGEFVCVEVPLYEGSAQRWIEHPSYLAAADLIVLPLTADFRVSLYPYHVDQFAHLRIEPGQTVNVVGFPFGERTGASFAVWATGFVATEPEIDHGGRPVFLIDCRTRKGQSGSPVIRYRNGGGSVTHDNEVEVISAISQFLGIYSGRINDESDLGTVWKSYLVSELLVYASALANSPAALQGSDDAA
jgi:hypothetical protein